MDTLRFVTDLNKGILGRPDPVELWEEIIAKIPDEVFMKPDVKILCVAFGHGTEADVIARRMLRLGRTEAEVKNAIFMLDKYTPFIGQAKKKGYINVIKGDFLEWKTDMKFDVVVGNPPYQGKAALHQQFFNKGFELLTPAGFIAFIQPATMYFNKKDNRRKGPETEMLATVNKHAVSVSFKDESVFEGADVGTKLAITVASPQKSTNVFDVTYLSGKQFRAESVDDVNQLEIDPTLFHSIRAKYKALCDQNGSYESVVRTENACKAYIAKIRGHSRGNDDFFTLVPRAAYRKSDSKFNTPADHDFGIPLESADHLENFYDYCETNFARMALALLKFNANSHMGELPLIPLVDFSRTYTDQELYDMAGFTQEEIQVIESTLPDYYNRKS